MVRKHTFTGSGPLFTSLFLFALVGLFAAGLFRFFLRSAELRGRIAHQRELIQTMAGSTDAETTEALRQRRDTLARRLESVSAELSSYPDAYSLGESVLKLLNRHSIQVHRYRPFEEDAQDAQKAAADHRRVPGFSFDGSAAPADILTFLQELSQEHSCWNITSIMITEGSSPGQLDISFDIVTGPELRGVHR